MKFLIILFTLGLSSISINVINDEKDAEIIGNFSDEELKIQVYEILKSKCNICHEVKNKRMVFTLENMDNRSKKIERQVFKWKRMPKDNEIKLTKDERLQLQKWILSLK